MMPKTKLSRRQFLAGSLTSAALLTIRQPKTSMAFGNFVESIWSGALTATSAKVNAKIGHNSTSVFLHMSPHPDFSNALLVGPAVANTAVNNRMVSLPITGLQPDTQYYYAIEADGLLDISTTGKLRTPGEGVYSFTFAFASCAREADHPVFDTIRQHNPLFFIHTGDMHYSDIDTNEIDRFRDAYDDVLTSPTQSAMFRDVPLAYMWDDHDYGANDSDKNSPSRLAARLTYQEYVPHYPLVAGSGDVPIYQAFTIGRVRFIMTDTRSERDPKKLSSNDPDKTMMGAAQKDWFKQQVLAANGQYPVIVWVSTSPWIADSPGGGKDNWNGFRVERHELADFIKDNEIRGFHMISGDVHMLAIDDGSNNIYATSAGPNFPIMQAAALSSSGSFLISNTYSEGQYPGVGQFGLMTVEDNGSNFVTVRWSGRNAANEEIVSWEHTIGSRSYLPLFLNA